MKLLGKLAILILVLATLGMGKAQQHSFVYISFHDKITKTSFTHRCK